jgi:glutathione synthase/RimK-type ligase-like ATP-grasp enzyme
METLVVVTHLKDWQLEAPGIKVITAREYLGDAEYSNMRRVKVFNLCRYYRYQSFGYYVSLLAEARGHKPIPTVMTIQDLRSLAVIRLASAELEDMIQASLKTIQSDKFTLSIYFGRNLAKRHERLAASLFKLFPAPFLKATFVRAQHWELQNISPMSTSEIPAEHRDFAFESAQMFFARRGHRNSHHKMYRFDLAILYDPNDAIKPSDPKAIEKFITAAENMGMATEIISRDDYGRLAEFDALFIRTTTAVNHYTYRFSQRAAAEGLVVIDDPVSILRCTNKVFLAELLSKHNIPTPRTRIFNRDNMIQVAAEVGFPAIIKKPDSSSSLGVIKVEDEQSFHTQSELLFQGSDLLLVQEYMPTEYDWRVGILDRRPIFAAKYYMAARHWQIIKHDTGGFEDRAASC